jgi:glucosamine--fructose-6-phosphate aminotransferase (isomerizing)
MCGIVGYIGPRNAYPILIRGLQRLEYRGYDSAGVALLEADKIEVYKKRGKVSELAGVTSGLNLTSNLGISHTRWATHGEPNDINAHPHSSEKGDFTLVHNGIVENYALLKDELISKGHVFSSQTDTEVLVHLVEDCYNDGSKSLEDAVAEALKRVVGTYGVVVISSHEPDKIITARKGSPVVIGVGRGEFFVASDAVPIVEYTKNVVYLNDGDLAVLKRDGITLKTLDNQVKDAEIQILEMEADALEKSGYEHFMLKEIMEQPKALLDGIRGRVHPEIPEIKLGGLESMKDRLADAKRILLVSCGTSWHTCLIAEHAIESLAGVPVEVDYASEFRYRNPIVTSEDVIIAISQSGETADTLEALRLAKSKGALILGVVNAVGSSIARETDAGVYMHCGPEIGVAATKTFTVPVTQMIMFALWLGKLKSRIEDTAYTDIVSALAALPDAIETALETNDQILEIAKILKDHPNALFLGRGANFPIALEGALKLKEISYIHAEGYPAAEMKHGPIALIDENLPVIFIIPNDQYYEKNISNLQEVKARKGRVIAITNNASEDLKRLADYVVEVPETHPLLTPVINVVPLQLLAYHCAVLRGCNVDQPRNLAKSVTVE